MGLFDIFKVKSKTQKPAQVEPEISVAEKKYYREESYYTDTKPVAIAGISANGSGLVETKVITFEERKKISLPSNSGLYVAEILLLEYCSYGKYPNPSTGYPGFWWFEYGIKNVGAMLNSLENRGYIEYGDASESLGGLKVDELKQILTSQGLSSTGKKADLIQRVKDNVAETILVGYGCEKKYHLTEKGKEELEQNQYVPFMHKHSRTTDEMEIFGKQFNIWTINKILAGKEDKDWKDTIKREETRATGLQHIWETSEERTYYLNLREILPRVPISKIKNLHDWDKGFSQGFPYYLKGLEYVDEGNLYAAIAYYNNARMQGYDAPALYTSYADAFHKMKMYSEEIEILKEGMKRDGSSQKGELFEKRIQKALQLINK